MSKILVTSALTYVNNIPHLGNLIGSVLSADVYARHKRLQGHEVLYVCGADEHGTTTEKKAREEGLTPLELCDKYGAKLKEMYDWFDLSFDVWGRTHTDAQTEIVQDIFSKLDENGYIQEKEVEQLYDEQEETFLADRFVEGTCPHCGADGARGDQCDSCCELLSATDLIDPISKISGTTPVTRSSKHLFLDLPALAPLVEAWMQEGTDWSDNAIKATKSWLENAEPRAITRDLSWGVPVPREGYEQKVFYVWFDAPIGYISITAQHRKDWRKWWNNQDVELAQFMGKDNIIFHSFIFPATLLGTGEEWTLANKLSVTEYLNLKDGKFSKSRRTGVFCDDCIEIEDEYGIPADAWRYVLLANRPETSDTQFSWEDFQERINNELIASMGNLVHRTIHFAHTKLAEQQPAIAPAQEALIQEAQQHAKRITDYQDQRKMRAALHELMKLCKHANKYFQHAEPWRTIKEEPELAAADIQALLSVIKDISILAEPFLPATSKKIQELLNEKNLGYDDLGALTSLDVQEPQILFEKIEDEVREELQETYSGHAAPLDLRVAKITEAKDHPNADRLFLIDIDLGSENRQLVAGLKGHYTREELLGKHVVVIANLEPATIRGERSEGMLLASEDNQETVGLLLADEEPGTPLRIGKAQPPTDRISFDEFTKLTLKSSPEAITVNGKAVTGAALRVDKDAYGTLR